MEHETTKLSTPTGTQSTSPTASTAKQRISDDLQNYFSACLIKLIQNKVSGHCFFENEDPRLTDIFEHKNKNKSTKVRVGLYMEKGNPIIRVAIKHNKETFGLESEVMEQDGFQLCEIMVEIVFLLIEKINIPK